MSVVFSDNFNTGTNPDTTNWLEAVGDWTLSGGKARGPNTAGFVILSTKIAAHSAITDVKTTVTQATTSGDGGPCARVTEADATPTMYVIDVFTNTLETYRYNNSGTASTLQSSGITQVANGVIALEVTGTGATVTLKAYYQGSQVGANISDTNASRIVAAGQTAIIDYLSAGTTDSDYDDFSVDDLAVVAVLVQTHYRWRNDDGDLRTPA